MAARLPTDLLQRSPEEASRLLALSYVEEITRACDRLIAPQDPEALHDFRVGLRRLRSCIRAFRQYLESSVSRKMRRRLRDLTLTTNSGRDTEVELGWLGRQVSRLEPGETEGLAWLIGRLEGHKHGTTDSDIAKVAGRFAKAAAKLRPALETYQVQVRAARGPEPLSFGRVAGQLVQSHASELEEGLGAVRGPGDTSEAHAARIRAKRLRYLLEPLTRRVPGVKSLVGRLKDLQDLLGNLHDMDIMAAEITSSVAALSARSADRTPGAVRGMLALQQLANAEAEASFQRFQTHWATGRAQGFFRRTNELGKRLSDPDRGIVPETENSAVREIPRQTPVPRRTLRLQVDSLAPSPSMSET